MHDAHLLLLGIPPDAPPHTILGLTAAEARNPEQIEAALRQRITQLQQHPNRKLVSHGDTQLILQSLHDAAAQLRKNAEQNRIAQYTTPELHQPASLTAFDRSVLGVLIAGGGWNARSRARLVALAAAHGITPHGLMTVLRGMADYAKSGAPVLPMAQGSPQPQRQPPPNNIRRQQQEVSRPAAFKPTPPQPKKPSDFTTLKLSLLFGLLTLLLGFIALLLLLPPQPSEPGPGVQDPPPLVQSAPPTLPAPPSARDTPIKYKHFDHRPTFHSLSPPPEALRAVDGIAHEIDSLQDIIRRLAVSGDEPAMIVYRSWTLAIDRFAKAWLLLDASTQQRMDDAVLEVLHAASHTPTVANKLLEAFMPQTSRLLTPLDIWQGVYMVRTLQELSTNQQFAPALQLQARTQLQVALGDALQFPPPTLPPGPLTDTAAGNADPSPAQIYLLAILPQLVEQLEFDPAAYEYWECWLAAQRRISGGEHYNRALMQAAQAILRAHPSLSTSTHATNVFGRLIEEVDFAHSPEVRRYVLSWLEDPAITSDALWTVSSILAMDGIAPWFNRALVVQPDATIAIRRRVHQDMQQLWTLPQDEASDIPVAIHVNKEAAERWNATFAKLHEAAPESLTDPHQHMTNLVAAAQLSEAAAMLVSGDHSRATQTLADIDQLLTREPPETQPPPSHLPTPVDSSNWRARYEDLRHNTEQKLRLLAELYHLPISDLAPDDAAVLVREALRGSPAEVRADAQQIILDRFIRSPDVALELLDQLPDAGQNHAVADLISQYTGQILPPLSNSASRSSYWAKEARLVLVNHALTLWSTQALDRLADELAVSYANQRIVLLASGHADESKPIQLTAAAEALVQTFDQLLGAQLNLGESAPERATLADRHASRLMLADSLAQQFVANQIAVLERLALLISHEQPHKRNLINTLLAHSAQARSAAVNLTTQALEVERAINQLWQLRMNITPEPVADARDDQTPYNASAHPQTRTATFSSSDFAAWESQLEALDPADPLSYFLLAEEIADAAQTPRQLQLAQHLFALAAVLAPDQLSSSACIAIAHLTEQHPQNKRRFMALASLLNRAHPFRLLNHPVDDHAAWVQPDDAAVLALCESMSFYRRGLITRATQRLERAGAINLLQSISHALSPRITEDLLASRPTIRSRPEPSPRDIVLMLQVEAALLAGTQRTFSADLALSGSTPLIDVDPTHLAEALSVDPTRTRFRNGHWVQ